MKLQDHKELMKRAFSRNTRRGYADWRDCDNLCMDVVENLDRATEELCAESRYNDLFMLCNWTYVKWCGTDKDDSNGETQQFCACVSEIWETIYRDGEQILPHRKMLDVLLGLLDGKVYDYMEDGIYDFILNHFKSEEELVKKEQFLLKMMEGLKSKILENDVYKYDIYVKTDYLARVLADQKRPIQEIRELLSSEERYTGKTLLAQIETEYGNFDEAITLYKEMINSRPEFYWSEGPRKALMEIYRKQGNITAYNNELFKMMVEHPSEDKYYLEYKALFSDEEWKDRWEALLEDHKDNLFSIHLWLSIEGRYDLIMDSAEPDNEFLIDTYGKKLFMLYPQRCFKVLANVADKKAQTSKKRADYRHIARTLEKIAAQPGGRELAAELAAKYRAQYPRRTAMLDELKRF